MTPLHVLGLFYSVCVETAWIWGPALVIGFLLGCAWNGCAEDETPNQQSPIGITNQESRIEQDVNGVQMDGP